MNTRFSAQTDQVGSQSTLSGKKAMQLLPPSSWFGYVFYTVVALTVVSGCMAYYLAMQERPTVELAQLFSACLTTWKGGSVSIFGLLALSQFAPK